MLASETMEAGVGIFQQVNGRGAACILASLLLAGCASPGVPRAPSLRLPAHVRDLSTVRSGDSVQLRFTAPDETTDHKPLRTGKGPVPLTASVCRVEGARCTVIQQLALVPGDPYTATDKLPSGLASGPPRPLSYRITVKNRAQRDAGPSRDAIAAAGEAPPAIAELRATNSSGGILLTWKPLSGGSIRVEARGEPSPDTSSGPQAAKSAPQLRLLQPTPGGDGKDPGGAVDAAPATGQRVAYRVYREQFATVNGMALHLQGAPADVTVIRAPDTFPPAVPAGLLALWRTADSGRPEIDLSWEANAETDLLGYHVYRATTLPNGTAGAFRRLTPAPLAAVSFADATAAPGETYRYTVSAVDRAGNESKPSVPAEIALRP